MTETDLFVNEGFGWECKSCRASVAHAGGADGADPGAPPRYFREGEAEEREPRLASRALARWHETPRGRALRCPRCGAEEAPPVEG